MYFVGRFLMVGCFVCCMAYCESCEEDVVPERDDEYPFDLYCPNCAWTIESGD